MEYLGLSKLSRTKDEALLEASRAGRGLHIHSISITPKYQGGNVGSVANYVAISFSATPTVAPAAGQPTVHAQLLVPPLLVALACHSLTHTSDSTSTSPL